MYYIYILYGEILYTAIYLYSYRCICAHVRHKISGRFAHLGKT